ncbi:twin-arginine translocase TatA/TatE family subunit [Pontibacter sp. 172403-2]|uniref:Sec-independent protein translocase subunit TatA/TatB n=1 Tax=Pontibacter rufus TaxID=2791028 RepID=UPI0018AFD9F5|nr:twin-arginine translocase TatA/TatE family subunit [Pontibacter sp. 172403-2]MBF9253521.1 twin-arginine translocase TatA/TatE family subunit [Pontibacter sp. 172403-2]
MGTTNIFALIGGLGTTEILLILLAILLLFGAKRIPELARGMGKGIREFKDASKDAKDEFEAAAKEDPRVK